MTEDRNEVTSAVLYYWDGDSRVLTGAELKTILDCLFPEESREGPRDTLIGIANALRSDEGEQLLVRMHAANDLEALAASRAVPQIDALINRLRTITELPPQSWNFQEVYAAIREAYEALSNRAPQAAVTIPEPNTPGVVGLQQSEPSISEFRLSHEGDGRAPQAGSGYVRRWNNTRGAYEYVKKEPIPQAGGEELRVPESVIDNLAKRAGIAPDKGPLYAAAVCDWAAGIIQELRASADAPKGDVRKALEPFLPADLEDDTLALDWHSRALRVLAAQLGIGNDFYYPLLGAAQKLKATPPTQDEGEALRSALFLANRDKESILRRLDTDIASVGARPKSGEINETLRDGALGALRAFRAAIVEGEWTAPREHLTATQKLENIEDAIVDSILAEPAGAEGEALRRALEPFADVADRWTPTAPNDESVAVALGWCRHAREVLSAPARDEGEAPRRALYALFKDGKKIGKMRESHADALQDAIEVGAATIADRDFGGQRGENVTVALNEGYDIKELGGAYHVVAALKRERERTIAPAPSPAQDEREALNMSPEQRLKDAEADVLRLHNEKMDFFDRAVAAEAEGEALRRALEQIVANYVSAPGRANFKMYKIASEALSRSPEPIYVCGEWDYSIVFRPSPDEGLRSWVQTVYDTFKKSEDQGYRSRDRQYAIDMLGKALELTPAPADEALRRALEPFIRERDRWANTKRANDWLPSDGSTGEYMEYTLGDLRRLCREALSRSPEPKS